MEPQPFNRTARALAVAILFCATFLTVSVPQGAAVGIHGFREINRSPNVISGGAEVACTAPFFINCSAVAVVAAGACIDFPVIGEECAYAVGCIGGGLSSVALPGIGPITGGGGGHMICSYGLNNDVIHSPLDTDTCSWDGTSGGCVRVAGRVGLGCPHVHGTGEGWLRVSDVSKDVEQVAAPPANQDAVSCDPEDLGTLARSVTGGWGGNSDSVVQTNLRAMIKSAMTNMIDGQIALVNSGESGIFDPNGVAEITAELGTLKSSISTWGDGLTVDSNYVITWPPPLLSGPITWVV